LKALIILIYINQIIFVETFFQFILYFHLEDFVLNTDVPDEITYFFLKINL